MVDNVEYSEVRTKRKRPSNMDGLGDALLVEILCRLPSSKTVVMCKSVCKHWSASISQPFFINRFVAHKAGRKITPSAHENAEVSKYDELKMQMTSDRTFGLVVRNMCGDTWKGMVIRFNDPINNPRDMFFSCLPNSTNKGLRPCLTVVGACNDWWLYQKHERFRFYLYNVQTRQCLVLPSRPGHRITTTNIGFVCDSNYSGDNFTPNEANRACVVVIPYTIEAVTEFPAYILSPSTGNMWCNVILSLPLRSKILGSTPMFWIGRKLYFFCIDELIGFDPFVDVKDGESNGVIKCHSLPISSSLVSSVSFFGVFHEQLYMCDREDNGRYRVWILEDYETRQWSLRHSIMGQDWIPRDHCLAELVNHSPLFGNAIGFHPANPDVIYVLTRRWIVLCNLCTS